MCVLLGEASRSPQQDLMIVPATVFELSLGPSRIIACQSKPFVFCIFRTLFKSTYPSHSFGFTASSSQNVISSLFMRLRTLLKTGSSASPFESAPCALFGQNMGGRGGTSFKQSASFPLRSCVVLCASALSSLPYFRWSTRLLRRTRGNLNPLHHLRTLFAKHPGWLVPGTWNDPSSASIVLETPTSQGASLIVQLTGPAARASTRW